MTFEGRHVLRRCSEVATELSTGTGNGTASQSHGPFPCASQWKHEMMRVESRRRASQEMGKRSERQRRAYLSQGGNKRARAVPGCRG